jgi:hypothetical protein
LNDEKSGKSPYATALISKETNLKALLNKVVDFRSRRFAFRGAGAEPPRRFAPAGSHLTSCDRRTLIELPRTSPRTMEMR